MDFDFEDNPMLKILVAVVIIVIVAVGAYAIHARKGGGNKTNEQNNTGEYAYVVANLPDWMTIQSPSSINPYIINDTEVRIPTDAKLLYLYGSHFIYSLDQNNNPVIFLSETITAKYTGPFGPDLIGVQYTAAGSQIDTGAFSNFWNFYLVNGYYIGTEAINGAPSIITLETLPDTIPRKFFDYGVATAMITSVSNTQVLLIINQTNEEGTDIVYGWWFLPDRIVFEKSYVINNTTHEYTLYMQVNADENQYITLALS